MFYGPSGVGKTETARFISNILNEELFYKQFSMFQNNEFANYLFGGQHSQNSFAKELLERQPIDCTPEVYINPDKTNFYDMNQSDIKIIGYPREEIKSKNPQKKLEIAI